MKPGLYVRLACALLATGAAVRGGDDSGAAIPPLRIALSDKMMPDVNLSDARAAFLVWTQEMFRNTELRPAPNQNWVLPSEQLLADIRAGSVDLFGITVQEYRQVARYVDASRILADDSQGVQLELVVRENSGITKMSDLRGRSLIMFDNLSANLAEQWLAVSFSRNGLDAPRRVLGRITKNAKLSQVVLPVFFGQIDACIVTRRGLDTMFELNPQLSKTLKIIDSSRPMASAFLAWRKDYPANLKTPVIERVLDLKKSAPAKQVLTMFQTRSYAVHDFDYLRSSLELLDAYDRTERAAAGKK